MSADRIAAVRHPDKVGCRPDRIAAVRHPDKVGCRPDRIAAVRHPDKVECWPSRIPDDFRPGGISYVTRRKGDRLDRTNKLFPYSPRLRLGLPSHSFLVSLWPQVLSSRASHYLPFAIHPIRSMASLCCSSHQQHGFPISYSWSHAWRGVPPTLLGCCQLVDPNLSSCKGVSIPN